MQLGWHESDFDNPDSGGHIDSNPDSGGNIGSNSSSADVDGRECDTWTTAANSAATQIRPNYLRYKDVVAVWPHWTMRWPVLLVLTDNPGCLSRARQMHLQQSAKLLGVRIQITNATAPDPTAIDSRCVLLVLGPRGHPLRRNNNNNNKKKSTAAALRGSSNGGSGGGGISGISGISGSSSSNRGSRSGTRSNRGGGADGDGGGGGGGGSSAADHTALLQRLGRYAAGTRVAAFLTNWTPRETRDLHQSLSEQGFIWLIPPCCASGREHGHTEISFRLWTHKLVHTLAQQLQQNLSHANGSDGLSLRSTSIYNGGGGGGGGGSGEGRGDRNMFTRNGPVFSKMVACTYVSELRDMQCVGHALTAPAAAQLGGNGDRGVVSAERLPRPKERSEWEILGLILHRQFVPSDFWGVLWWLCVLVFGVLTFYLFLILSSAGGGGVASSTAGRFTIRAAAMMGRRR